MCCSVQVKYAETLVLWLTLPVSAVLLKPRVRNLRAEPFLVPAVCQPAAKGTCQRQSWMEPCQALPAGRCSLQPSYFPGAVPASHLHLYLPIGVQTLNGVLQMSDRLEMQILWHKNCPISANTVLQFSSWKCIQNKS